MPSVSSLAQITFSNLGPLTTTFTAPSSCATLTGATAVGEKDQPTDIVFDTDCSNNYDYWDCFPEGSKPSPTTTVVNPAAGFAVNFFSPGIYCPSGWKTVGVASRDGDKAVTSAGAFVNDTVIRPGMFLDSFPNPANVLMQALDPSETAVLCCPSSMTGATGVGCYSTLPSITPTAGCVRIYPEGDLERITATYWYDGVTITGVQETLVATSPVTSIRSLTLSGDEVSDYVAVSMGGMVTLVHKADDVKATGTGGAATTSNAAMKITSRPSWDGLGGVSVVCLLGFILGAAIIVPM